MRWRKLGHVFSATGQHPWMQTHASNPTAETLSGGRVRVYFSTRDAQNRSHVASLVFAPAKPAAIIDLSSTPLVAPGERGLFDDSGVSMGCLAVLPDQIRLYYLGWNLGVTVPWRNAIGIATSTDGGHTFHKASPAPLLDRNAVDPFSLSYPWVLRDGAHWQMWYGTNLRWGSAGSHDMHYVIKYAESPDGLSWHRANHIAIPPAHPSEYALARPCVIREPGIYRMWFTHRGAAYRIGYAESTDGRSWQRNDPAGAIEVGGAGEWDSEMVTYPCVFDSAGARYLLYNGNAYGRTGFGVAVLE